MTPLSVNVGGELKTYNPYLWKKTNRSLPNILIGAVFLGRIFHDLTAFMVDVDRSYRTPYFYWLLVL